MTTIQPMSSLELDEEALALVANDKKPIFILQWLCYLDKTLPLTDKNTIKQHQKTLIDQLLKEITNSPGPPARRLIARNLATLFSIGDTFLLFDAGNKCNDILKNRDDSPAVLPSKLAAITSIGAMYQKLGRIMGRSYEETVGLLLKSLKSAESQTRCEIFRTLESIIAGMGVVAAPIHRDIFKAIRHGLSDRVMSVRVAAAGCLRQLIHHATFLVTSEVESVFSICFRAFEGSNYDVRCSVSEVLATLFNLSQSPSIPQVKNQRHVSIEELLSLLSAGFKKGGIGFLKSSSASDMIKGASIVNREIRLGVTYVYGSLIHHMGTVWIEKHVSLLISQVLDLLNGPRASTSHVEAVYSRKCVHFILTCMLGKMLSEKTQALALKELINCIRKYNTQGTSSTNEVSIDCQHALICALDQTGSLIERLGTSSTCLLNDPSIGAIDVVISVLSYPAPAARLAAAYTLRSFSVSCPSHLTPLVERCLEHLESISNVCPKTLAGYSCALAALMASSVLTPLGISHCKGKLIFTIAEDMLRSAGQNSRLSLQRIQSGWLMIGSVITLGPSIVKTLLPRLLLLWKNSFPRTAKELESEKAKGDAFTWQVTMENRSGALTAMDSLLTYARSLVTDEIVKRIIAPLELAVTMLTSLSDTLRTFGPAVRAAAAQTRLRLYRVLLLLDPRLFDSCHIALLRLLVSEFTLGESASNATTSLLYSMCNVDDDIILGSCIQRTEHRTIEDQMQPNNIGSGALEHDMSYVYKVTNDKEGGPFPLGVTVIDASCQLFGHVFSCVSNKHRLQMLNHFTECIKHAKSTRQEAIQINVLAALLASLKNLTDSKCTVGSDEVKNACLNFILTLIPHNNPCVRSAAAQALGRLGQVVADARFVSEVTQACVERLKASKELAFKTGYSLALGCLHRHVGSLGSSQSLNNAFAQLLALSHDSASPIIQVWSLHSMSLIAYSSGPMFKLYVPATLTQSLRLLMNVPLGHCDVHQCIGKLLTATIIAVGPELQSDSPQCKSTRSSLLIACSLMQEHCDPLVKAEAIACLQQLHMFAPSDLDLASLVPRLCTALDSPHLFLRKAAVSCLYQLTQMEADEVYKLASNWAKSRDPQTCRFRNILQGDHGLPGVLFCMLDTETDDEIVTLIHKMFLSFIQSIANDHITDCVIMVKEVLTAIESNSTVSSPDREFDSEDGDLSDDTYFKSRDEHAKNSFGPPKWRTRVFAASLLQKIIITCDNSDDRALHFDLAKARDLMASEKVNFLTSKNRSSLVLYLSDLIRMAFMCATSDSDQLRLEGLKTLGLIIAKFSTVPEPEFANHLILEQYQAQVGSALRPAFSPDTPAHVTAIACQVCSAWIGSGVAHDLNDLRRVHQLLVSSLAKLKKDDSSRQYNESALTMEKLAILKAWAEVYIVAMNEEEARIARHHAKQIADEDDDDDDDDDAYLGPQESLLKLVSPELEDLSRYWLLMLKDHAFLTLPDEYMSHLPHDGGNFYSSSTCELARPLYRSSWPPVLHAVALWLGSFYFKRPGEDLTQEIHLLFGICMEALCNPKSTDPMETVIVCLTSLKTLLSHELPSKLIVSDHKLSIELCTVLHRLILTRESSTCHQLILAIIHTLLLARIRIIKEAPSTDADDSSEENNRRDVTLEGTVDGQLKVGESISYCIIQICLCILVRRMPHLSPSIATDSSKQSLSIASTTKVDNYLSSECEKLVCLAMEILADVPHLCSCEASVQVLPIVLYLITNITKEISQAFSNRESFTSVLFAFKKLTSSSYANESPSANVWCEQLRSSLSYMIDLCKTSEASFTLDESLLVQVICIFISNAPPCVSSDVSVKFPSINLLSRSLRSNKIQLQLDTLQAIKDIFSLEDKNVSVPFIISLGPRVFEILASFASFNSSLRQVKLSTQQVDVAINAIQAAQLLVDSADKEKRFLMLTLFVPILINLLSDRSDTFGEKSEEKRFHNYVLNCLLKLAPVYRDEFKQIVTKVPALKSKLEHSLRNQDSSNINQNLSNSRQSQANRTYTPSIKLKTDFSNYN